MARYFAAANFSPNGFNFEQWKDDTFEASLKTIETSTDPKVTDAAYRKAHERLVDDPPWLYIVHDLNPRAMSPKVKGFVSPQSWFVDLTLVSGMYMMITKKGPVFFGETTVNINPSVQELVDITVLIEHSVRQFNVNPRVGILSYSNFGSNVGPVPEKTREAVKILHEKYPDMVVDGDMQANFALNSSLLADNFPFSTLNGAPANTLIFPNLESGNIAYKLLQEIGGAEAVGPILLGLKKSVHVLQLGSSVREIVNMVTIAVVDAQEKAEK